MKKLLVLVCAVSAIFCATAINAQVKVSPDKVIAKMKPLLNDDTLAVIHLDLANINVATVLENNRKFIDKMFKDRNVSEAELKSIVEKMVQESPDDFETSWKNFVVLANEQKRILTNDCGIDEAFIVFQLGKTFPVFWYVAIPKTDKLNTESINNLLKMSGDYLGLEEAVVRETDKYFFFTYPMFGSYSPNPKEQIAEKLGTLPPTERRDFVEAFYCVHDPIKIVVAIPSYVKKVVAELNPKLPESLVKELPAFGGIDIVQLVSAVKYTAIGINPEHSNLGILVQMNSKEDTPKVEKQVDSIVAASLNSWLDYLKSLKEQSKESIVETPEDTLVSLYPDLLNEKTIEILRVQLKPTNFANRGDGFIITYTKDKAEVLFAGSKVSALRFFQASVSDVFSRQKRVQCQRNIKEIMLAMHNYHDVHGKFPLAFSVDKDGKPLHSWRVHILPYVEQTSLYNSIKLDEPWDSEHNKQFHDKMPKVFACPANTKGNPKRDTVYSVIVGDKTAFRTDGKEFTFGKITDGTSCTIAVVERVTPVNWMSPEDVTFDAAIKGINKVPEGIGSEHYQSVNVGIFDGGTFNIKQTVDQKLLEALITIAGGEDADLGKASR